MIDLVVVFVDKRAQKFTIFEKQNSCHWSDIFRVLNPKEYSMRSFGGSRKTINAKEYIKNLKQLGYRENKGTVDFQKIINSCNF